MAEKNSESEPVSPLEAHTKPQSNPQHQPNAVGGERPRAAMWILGAVGAAVVGLLVFGRGGKTQSAHPSAFASTAAVGELTLQTADRNELDCMADKGIENYQCGAVDEKQSRQIDEGQKLRPFMTTDRQLYLVPGLFLEPAVSQRYNAETPSKPRDQLRRFTAKCKLTTIGELDNVRLRWSTTGSWEPPKKFPVATVSGCTIEG